MVKKMITGLVVLSLALFLTSISQAAEKKDIAIKYGVFKQVQAKGHEVCYAADLGNGVLAVIMYGEEGPVKDKQMAMELAFMKEAWDKLPENERPEGAKWHSELNIYSKHFYAHETPHEMHLEHGKGEHKH